jgi:hypothetical protein
MQVINRLLFTVTIIVCGFHFTTLAQLNPSEINSLSKGADVILTGKVTEQASSWNESKTRIYTQATILVDEYIKGNGTGNTVTVKYLGGEVGEIGEKYSHMPRFVDNEDVLVFLKKDNNNADYKVFNGENGKISVIKDSKSGEKVTTSNVQINSLKAQIKNYINE